MKRFLGALLALWIATPALADPAGAGVNPGTAGTQSDMAGCVYRSGSITPSNGQQMGLACGSDGTLLVTATTTPGGTQDVNLKQVAGAATAVGTGASNTGTQRVTTATDSTIGTVTAVTAITNPLPAGTNVLGHIITDTGSTTVVTGTVAVSVASLPLPTGAATSANQTNASQKTQIVDGSGNVIASTSNNLNVQCANCSGSGASAVDEASFTAGTSVFAPSGGFFQTTATTGPLTNGQQGMAQMTSTRALFTNLRNAAGTEVGTSTTPLQVTLANTGANATAVKVDGSAVTQPVSGTVTANIGTSGSLALDATVAKLNLAQGSTTSGQTGPLAQGAVTTSAPSYTTAQTSPLSLDTAGNLRVTGSVTIPSNASVNVAQVNGVTTLTGAGATGTGSQRNTVAQDTTTIAGSAPGTAGTPSANVVSIQGVSSGTNLPVSQATAANLNATVVGTGTFAAQTTPQGGSNQANVANFVSGAANTTGSSITTIITAPGSGKLYITGAQCFRTDAGTTTAFVTFNDAAGTTMILPAGGGANAVFTTPLVGATTTAFRFTPSTGLTTVYCNAQGYNA